MSNKAFCTKDLQKLYAYINDRYDCLVIGSDAVFNWKQNGFPTAFIPDYGFTIPVMTYAASVHGLRYYDEQPEKLAYCRRVFEKMAFIGTRDACTAQFVKCCMPEAEPVFCCDPTLFIDQDKIAELAGDYVGRVEKKYCFSLKEKYIVQMVADSALTRQIRERYGHEYKIVTLFRTARHADIYLYDLNPFEWAMVLRGAAATITSYFHGTLLSLVQGTPVVALDYSGYDGTYESKLYDLMNTRLNLPGFYHTKQYAKEFTEDEAFWPVFEKMLSGGYTEAIGESIEVAAQSVRVFVDVVAEKAVMRNG